MFIFHLSGHIHLSFRSFHVIFSFLFNLYLTVSEYKRSSFWCSNLYKHFESTPIHQLIIIISFRALSLFCFSSHVITEYHNYYYSYSLFLGNCESHCAYSNTLSGVQYSFSSVCQVRDGIISISWLQQLSSVSAAILDQYGYIKMNQTYSDQRDLVHRQCLYSCVLIQIQRPRYLYYCVNQT